MDLKWNPGRLHKNNSQDMRDVITVPVSEAAVRNYDRISDVQRLLLFI